jgi:alpha-1,2-mannosyltransferase
VSAATGATAGMANSRRTLRIAGLIFLVAGAIGWALIYFIFRTTPGQDWMVFDTAAQAWRRGDIPLLLDGPRFTAVLNATHTWLREPLVFHPWVYPPYTMLLALPFGLLPWWLNYTAFLSLSLAGLVLALRLWRPAGLSRTVLIAGVLFCPATAFTFGAGQNSFMSAGLVTAGIWFMHRRPPLAGLCLGLLAFKPQLAILVPVALAASGAWAAMAYATATVLALLGGSLIIPGPALWAGWLHLFLSGDPAFHQWVNAGRIYGQSVFTCLRIAGVPDSLANAGQGLAILFAAACVWRAYRGAMAEHHRFAVLLAAMILAAAHLGDYDCMLLGVAAMLILTDGLARVFQRGEAALAIAVWVSTGFQPPFVFHAAVVTPLIVAAFLLRVLTLRPALAG